MEATIYCKVTAKGIHSFYYTKDEETYFLFSQDYRKGVNEYFKNGVPLRIALDYPNYHRHDTALIRTKSKLPSYIKYIEKMNGLEILEQTKKKSIPRRKEKIEKFSMDEILAEYLD